MATSGLSASTNGWYGVRGSGVDRPQIIMDVTALMPEMPDDVRFDIAASLGRLGRSDPALAAVVEELRQQPAFEQALAEARQLDEE